MVQFLSALCAGALVLAAPQGSPRTTHWVKVETPNFVVYGESNERRTRHIAAEFERFREALGNVIAGAAAPAAVPTIVVVFDTQRSFDPYKPLYKGKPVRLGGYFVGARDHNLVAMASMEREEALRLIFHEYAHLVINNGRVRLPPWLNEGLAEYYSTFSVQADGTGGVLGKVIDSHLLLLNQSVLLPIEQLLGATLASNVYNEGERRSLFYAQSWGIVHYLLSGEPSRFNELAAYIEATNSGVSPVDAWHRLFPGLDINRELKHYVTRKVVRGFQFRFANQIQAVKEEVTKPQEGEIKAALALLLRSTGRSDGATQLLEGAISTPSGSARARAVLATLKAESYKYAEARALLNDTTDEPGDWLTHYYRAQALTRIVLADTGSDTGPSAAAARLALASVTKARPELSHVFAMAAALSLTTGEDLHEGLEAITRARSLAAGREDYALIEAHIHARLGDFATARKTLGPFMTSAHAPHVRDMAREAMGDVVRAEQARALSQTRRDDAVTDALRQTPSTGAGEVRPVFRRLEQGEERSEGTLQAIECSDEGSVVLHVRIAGADERFSAERMDLIDFISYRADLQGGVQCGARATGDSVYVTWRPAGTSGTARRAIAVEFLPR